MGVPLPSAEIYARAIIAAAISFGDDPEKSITGPRGVARRALAPAACAIASVGQLAIDDVIRPLGVNMVTVRQARVRATEGFVRAEREAQAACRHAGLAPRPSSPPVAALQPAAVEPAPPRPAPPPAAPVVAKVAVEPVRREATAFRDQAARLAELRRDQRPVAAPVHRPAPPPEPARPLNVRPAAPMQTDLETRILEALEGGDAITSQGLATRLDAKESVVISALTHLEARHLIVSAPAPESASRRYVWKVTPIKATAHG